MSVCEFPWSILSTHLNGVITVTEEEIIAAMKFGWSINMYWYMLAYRALQVTCQRLESWMSSNGKYRHGNASLNLFTAAPNLITVLYNPFRRPHLQTKSSPIPYFH